MAESIKKPVLKPPSGLRSRQGESPDVALRLNVRMEEWLLERVSQG
jgi:hypothetical protein